MKPMTVLGIVLIALGGLALAFQGFSYMTRDTVVDIGPIEATVEREERVEIPPVAGAIVLAAGVALLLVGRRR